MHMRRFFVFWWKCAQAAFWGNTAFANDWQWLVGYPLTAAILWVIGYFYASFSGRIDMTLSTGALGALAAAFIAYVLTWLASFVLRLFNQPVILFHEQKDRADKLEKLRQIANDSSQPPSFDIGIESPELPLARIASFYEMRATFPGGPQKMPINIFDPPIEVCRVWVENLEHSPTNDCRVVIEDFRPDSPVKNGVLLIPDNRGADDKRDAKFNIAATEKRYFKFLRLIQPIGEENLNLVIKSDQDRTGLMGIFDRAKLSFEKRYFATIAVHGKNARSRRMNLVIDATSEDNIKVSLTPTQKMPVVEAT
jgi:hypothetical protein